MLVVLLGYGIIRRNIVRPVIRGAVFAEKIHASRWPVDARGREKVVDAVRNASARRMRKCIAVSLKSGVNGEIERPVIIGVMPRDLEHLQAPLS